MGVRRHVVRANALLDERGNAYAFDVRLSRRSAIAVVKSLPGLSLVDTSINALAPEPFCRFEVKGHFFKLYEPDGHVRRVVVEPERPPDLNALDSVRRGFEATPSSRNWLLFLIAAAGVVAAAIVILREG